MRRQTPQIKRANCAADFRNVSEAPCRNTGIYRGFYPRDVYISAVYFCYHKQWWAQLL